MIRRHVPAPAKDRPWLITLTVNGKVLTTKRPLAFLDAGQGKVYADTLWLGVHVELKHEKTGETWTRTPIGGAWSHTPAPPAPQPARAPLWYERD